MATCDGSADSSVHSLVRLRENCQLLQQTYFTFFQKIIRIQPGSSLLNPGCPISWAAAHINSVYLETSVPSWRHSMHMPCLTSSRSTVPLHHTATPCRISYRSVWLSIGSLTLDIKCDSRNTDRTYNRKVKASAWKLCPGGSWDTFQSQRKAVGILGGSHTPGERDLYGKATTCCWKWIEISSAWHDQKLWHPFDCAFVRCANAKEATISQTEDCFSGCMCSYFIEESRPVEAARDWSKLCLNKASSMPWAKGEESADKWQSASYPQHDWSCGT